MRKETLIRLIMAILVVLGLPAAQAIAADPFHPMGAVTAIPGEDGEDAIAAARAQAMGASSPMGAPAMPTAPAPMVTPTTPPTADYGDNTKSEVFGANLFTGSFARETAAQFNPEYVVTVGDRVQVRLWGAFVFNDILTVDPQGNVFIPNAGPVTVAGVRNGDLQKVIEGAISGSFRNNVYSYASLAAAQPVRVYVGGFVNRPGLYSGTSSDSLLRYLDQAGGIDPERGSFLSVQVKRGTRVRAEISLYDFLLRGLMPQIQLGDGDVIFVAARQHTVRVSGLAESAKIFEFPATGPTSAADVIAMARPLAEATHVRIVRNTGTVRNVEYYPLSEAGKYLLENGDELEFTADKQIGTITVRVEGEHMSAREYVLPHGARLSALLSQVRFSEESDRDNIQLFRVSVKERQKKMLDTSLKSLESAALTARSGTSDEARLRSAEADLILQWVERAKSIEPNGQVVIARSTQRNDLLLENGDILHVPVKDDLVLVSGEVLFPNAVAFEPRLDVEGYIGRAGGYTQNGKSTRIIVARRDGTFLEVEDDDHSIHAGDEILVLPKIDVKKRQIWKDMTQILYQIAVSAKVVLGL